MPLRLRIPCVVGEVIFVLVEIVVALKQNSTTLLTQHDPMAIARNFSCHLHYIYFLASYLAQLQTDKFLFLFLFSLTKNT